jgi:flavin-dependent dehydrogenase
VVPINGEKVRIGLLTQNDPYGCFNRFIKNFNPKMSADLSEDKIQSRPIAQGLLTKTYGNRVLAVGEAAGQVKTTTGGGIFYGLLCSDLASRVISENIHENCLSADALSEYEKLWKKAIQKEILVGYYTRKICEKLSDSQIENMFQIAKSDGVIPLLRSKGNFDWQSEVIMALAKKAPIRSIQAICRIKSLG